MHAYHVSVSNRKSIPVTDYTYHITFYLLTALVAQGVA